MTVRKPTSSFHPYAFALALALSVGALAAPSRADEPPITKGVWEYQGGASGIVLPESFNGTWSLQLEGRVGYFIGEGWELQGMINGRVWPLGSKAPKYVDLGGSVLYFPEIGGKRNMYVLGGAGVAKTDPNGPPEGGFKPLIRAGFGFKVPMSGLKFLGNAFLTMEYRGEMVFIDDAEFFEDPTIEDGSDFVSGAAIGLSWFQGEEKAPPPAAPPPPEATTPK